jgi:oligopeptidase A
VNSFDHAPGEAHFSTYQAADVPAALDAAEAAARDALDAISGDVLAAFCDATVRLDFVEAIARELDAVLGGDWTPAAGEAARRAARFRADTYQRRDLYDAIAAVEPSGPVERRLKEQLLRGFRDHGVLLDGVRRERLAAIKARLAALGPVFRDNIRAADARSGVIVDDPAGLPEALIEEARGAAAARGLDGLYVPYSEANATAVLRDAHSPAVRQAMYRLNVGRAAQANLPIVAEMLALRRETADLLGYPNFAAMRLAGRMLDDPQAFLDELHRRYRPTADREHAELVAFARAYTGYDGYELTAADVDVQGGGFFATRMRSVEAASAVAVPFDVARRVMLDALAEMYAVTFAPAAVAGWHPDVEVWDVIDTDGRHAARIWCDWFARTGKSAGGWMSLLHTDSGGGVHLGTVCANFPRTEIGIFHLRIMWHEFGHAMHHAFTRTRYRLLSSIHVPLDFAEAPAKVMENWVFAPEVMARMGVDPEVAETARAEDRVRAASRKIIGLIRPALDLAVHRGDADPVAVKQRYLPVPVEPDDATIAHFFHIFGSDYEAAHYAYQWAAALDAELFTRFAADGVLNPATGRDYAERVLAPAGEREPADLIRDFLGRDISLDAMLARDGISGAAAI